ncbi:MAG: tetratricopeptide repeat protein [bacterium]|nr:tetratricopeptide repeat protein [bacterium]
MTLLLLFLLILSSLSPLQAEALDEGILKHIETLKARRDMGAARELIHLYMDNERYDEAISTIKETIKNHSGDISLWLNLGEAYQKKGDLTSALTTYEEFLKKFPGYTSIQPRIFQLYKDLDMVEKVISSLEDEISREPSNLAALKSLGEFTSWLGDTTKAIGAYQKASSLAPKDIEIKRTLAQLYRQVQRYEEALAIYQRLLELSSRETYYYREIGNLYAEQGKFDEAGKAWEGIVRINPQNIYHYQMLAQAYLDWGKLDEAIASYLRARPIQPNQAVFARELAELYQLQGKTEKAIPEYLNHLRAERGNLGWVEEKLAELGLERAINWLEEKSKEVSGTTNEIQLLANLHLRASHPDKAISGYEVLFRQRPDQGGLFLSLAGRLEEAGFKQQALNVYRRVITQFSGRKTAATAGLASGRILIDSGQYQAAQKNLEEIVNNYEESPEHMEALFLMGEIYLDHLNDFQQARKIYQVFSGDYPTSDLAPIARIKIGDCYLREGKIDLAREEYEKVSKKPLDQVNASEAGFKMADSYYFAGDFEQAQRAYQAFISSHPRSDRVNDALNRLRLIGEGTKEDLDVYREAEMLFLKGEFEPAASGYRRIISADSPSNLKDDALFALASLYLKSGDKAQAREMLQKITGDYPKSRLAPTAQNEIASLYSREGDYKAAVKVYLSLIKTYPDTSWAVLAQGEINKLRQKREQ